MRYVRSERKLMRFESVEAFAVQFTSTDYSYDPVLTAEGAPPTKVKELSFNRVRGEVVSAQLTHDFRYVRSHVTCHITCSSTPYDFVVARWVGSCSCPRLTVSCGGGKCRRLLTKKRKTQRHRKSRNHDAQRRSRSLPFHILL